MYYVFSQFYRVLNIRVALVGLEVWSDADKCAVTQDPFTTLHEFLDWRKLKLLPQQPHDNAQLIRYKHTHFTHIITYTYFSTFLRFFTYLYCNST